MSFIEETNVQVQPSQPLKQLWPAPQHVFYETDPTFVISQKIQIILSPFGDCNVLEMINIWKNYTAMFDSLDYELCFLLENSLSDDENIPDTIEIPTTLICTINKSLFIHSESYTLTLGNTIRLIAINSVGLHHGIQTFLQILSAYSNGSNIATFTIQDWPSFPYRAFRINLSVHSAKTPTKETFENFIEIMASLKFNQLHLICDASPEKGQWQMVTSSLGILEILLFCKNFGISVIPALETAKIANVDDLRSLQTIYEQYLLCFPEPKFISIGENLKHLLLKSKGGIHKWCSFLPCSLHRTTLLIEGNLSILKQDVIETIGVVKEMPPVRCKRQQIMLYLQSAITNSIGGCSKILLPKLKTTIEAASARPECIGVIVDISSTSVFLPLTMCLPGLVSCAGLAWNAHSVGSQDDDILSLKVKNALNRHLQDKNDVIGQIIQDMSEMESDFLGENSTSLLHLLLNCPDKAEFEKSSAIAFQKGIRLLNQIQSQLHRADLNCLQNGEITTELQIVADLALLATKLGKSLVSTGTNPNATWGFSVINVGVANLPSTSRTDLANRLLGLMEQFRIVWLSRYNPHNLPISMLMLQNLINQLVPEEGSDFI